MSACLLYSLFPSSESTGKKCRSQSQSQSLGWSDCRIDEEGKREKERKREERERRERESPFPRSFRLCSFPFVCFVSFCFVSCVSFLDQAIYNSSFITFCHDSFQARHITQDRRGQSKSRAEQRKRGTECERRNDTATPLTTYGTQFCTRIGKRRQEREYIVQTKPFLFLYRIR